MGEFNTGDSSPHRHKEEEVDAGVVMYKNNHPPEMTQNKRKRC
jgi:hypothetical protein